MIVTVASLIVLLVAFSLCLFAVWGFVAPAKAMRWVKVSMDADWGIWFAVGIRLVLGIALIISAPQSDFPVTFQIIGWIAIAAAIGGIMLGRERLRRFTDWWLAQFAPWATRLWLLVALAFGGFLVYGAL